MEPYWRWYLLVRWDWCGVSHDAWVLREWWFKHSPSPLSSPSRGEGKTSL
jgi:hypothetical protein